MVERLSSSLVASARDHLVTQWALALRAPEGVRTGLRLPTDILDAIERSVNSPTITYRYVLPTQVLAKAVRPELDCRSVQASCGLSGAFDARSVCHEVIVEFDRLNNNVLGGSTEPYVNKPLRIPSVTEAHRHAQRNKAGFDDLCRVLDYTQANPDMTEQVLEAVLCSIRKRLRSVSLTYPVPNRVSLHQTQRIITEFLRERTGGARIQSLTVALFREVGARLGLFSEVRSGNINASDAGTGSAADLECADEGGSIVMAVEVKDRRLTLRHTQDKLPPMREKGIRELLFLVQQGVVPEEREAISALIEQEFVSGQNVYVCEFSSFLESCLVLFGESGRRSFLKRVGEELERQRVDLSHRQKWSTLLRQV